MEENIFTKPLKSFWKLLIGGEGLKTKIKLFSAYEDLNRD